jgi:hypothetical protein
VRCPSHQLASGHVCCVALVTLSPQQIHPVDLQGTDGDRLARAGLAQRQMSAWVWARKSGALLRAR